MGEEVRERFAEGFSYSEELFRVVQGEEGAPQLRVDLWMANRRQLLAAGLQSGKITMVGECTGCARDERGGRRYFSHRMEAARTGRMMNVVGISAAKE